MSWTRTNHYYRTLRGVERELDSDASVPWRPELAEVFGTRDGLRSALLTRWRTIVEAQGEDLTTAELAVAHPGLARLVGLRPGVADLVLVAS